MFYLILVAVFMVAGLLVLMKIAKRPYYRKNANLAEVRGYLHALLKRGFDGGFVIIEDMNSERFVQFSKYVRDKGHIGIEFSFPKAPWSVRYYDKIKDFLMNQNIAFVIQQVNSHSVTEFVDVDCDSDIDLSVGLVKETFYNIFGIQNPSFRIRPVNISVRDELIDTKSVTRREKNKGS